MSARRFVATVAGSDLRAPVPGCPGWTAYDLVTHLGNVHAWAATIVETGRRAAQQNDEPRTRRPRVVADWYAGKAEDLLAVLRAADPHQPCWNFVFGDGPDSRARFWSRRQLHETVIHQGDLDAAAGCEPQAEQSAPGVVAADGVAEVLGVFLKLMHDRGHPARLAAPLCLVAEDTRDTWTLTPRPGGEQAPAVPAGPPQVVERRHRAVPHHPAQAAPHHPAQPDRVEAPSGVLHRLLWRRLPPDDPQVRLVGNRDRLTAFLQSPLTP